MADQAAHRTIKNWQRQFSSKPASSIAIIDRGDWYQVFAEDATFIANDVLKCPTSLKKLSTQGADPSSESKSKEPICLEYLNVNKNQYDTLLQELLIVRQFRVELYVPVSDKTGPWELKARGSPANLGDFEDLLFGEGGDGASSQQLISVNLVAVKLFNDTDAGLGSRSVALACLDTNKLVFSVAEFSETDEHFGNLASALVQLAPKEILVIPAGSDGGADSGGDLKIICERHRGALVTERKVVNATLEHLEADLNRLLKFRKTQSATSVIVLPQWSNHHAMSCVSTLIQYLEIMSDTSAHGKYRLETFSFGSFMRIDTAALTALNIIPELSGGSSIAASRQGAGGELSLFSVLCQTKTGPGERTLIQWLRQPLTSVAAINDRLDIVEALVKSPCVREDLAHGVLPRIPDLGRLAKRFSRRRATLQDCYVLYKTVAAVPPLIEKAAELQSASITESSQSKLGAVIDAILIQPLQSVAGEFIKYTEMLETVLDFESAESDSASQEYRIKPEFDENLLSLHEKISDTRSQVERTLPGVGRQLGLDPGKGVKLDSNESLGYFYRITKKEEKSLRGCKAFSIIDAQKNGVRFTSAELTRLNADYMEAKAEYQETQSSIVTQIVGVSGSYLEPMHRFADVIGVLDALVSLSLAAVSAPIPYVRPEMVEASATGSADTGSLATTQELTLVDARHPCLERQDEVSFIPNDICMKEGQSGFHIITGPNMGGKSTYIRMVGMLTLMAQCGSFVPATSARLTVKDAILTRIGASDCALRGVSTFMAEMLESASILRSATSSSLLIIDELGRGTSTYDGYGIARGLAEHIASNIGCFCLFATHFHELTSMASTVRSVVNSHVTVLTSAPQDVPVSEDQMQEEPYSAPPTFTLLYKVSPGPCDRSFGIHIAEMIGLPAEVIADAKAISDELELADGNQGSTKSEDILKVVSDLKKSSGGDVSVMREQLLAKFDQIDNTSQRDI